LKSVTSAEDFWLDKTKAEKVFADLSAKQKRYDEWVDLNKSVMDLKELINVMSETVDEEEVKEIEDEYRKLKKRFGQAETAMLLNGKFDNKDCILTVHAGTGGVDAMDWAQMLFRMFGRFAEKKGFKTEVISSVSGEEAGLKSATIEIKGLMAYGNFKSESGVHRLVRQSPFNAKALRQTSFALVEVIPVLDKDISVEINKDDLKIDTYRSSGHGGQSVNKTDSAVRITHLPTGIVVACQNERSQLQNKERAMHILKSKLYALKEMELKEKETILKGDTKQGSWGNQIRSYVLHPYQMVKDHRTEWETSDTSGVLDGDLEDFVEGFLRNKKQEVRSK
jgi:peptide chain release factor 2